MKALDKQAFLVKTFESSLDAIIYTDEKGYIVEVNKAYVELTGYKKEEIIGKHTSEFSPMKEGTYECTTGELIQIDKKFSEQLKATIKTYVEKGKLQNVMGYQMRKDRKLVPVEDTMLFLVGDDGERIGGVAVIRDNTERRKREIEIRETKDYLENIIMTSVDGVIIGDAEGKIAAVNKAAEKIFDCSIEQLVGKHTTDMGFVKGKDKVSGKEMIEKLLNEGTISGVERTLKKSDGDYIVIEMNIALLKDDEGNITGSVASIRDITARKKAEELLIKSEEKYYSLIEHANDAIISLNREGIIIGFNKRAEEMFGYSREELIGKHSYSFVFPQGREKDEKVMQKFRETGTKFSFDRSLIEGKGLKKNGEKIDVEYSFYIIEIEGEPIINAIMRDIGKRKEEENKILSYQNQLKSLTAELILAEQKERQYFSDFLHDEIGQQLFATRLQLEQLKESLSSAENTKTLDNALNSLRQVINQSRTLTIELSSPILNQLGLEKALDWLAEETYKKYDIRVTFKDDKREKPLDDNAKILLYNAVSELLTNVAKHAQTKSANVSIWKDNSNVRICVEDKGVGFDFPKEHSSDTKLEGIGLFRIKERLESFGGQLEIESQPNRGTNITLVAPLSNSV